MTSVPIPHVEIPEIFVEELRRSKAYPIAEVGSNVEITVDGYVIPVASLDLSQEEIDLSATWGYVETRVVLSMPVHQGKLMQGLCREEVSIPALGGRQISISALESKELHLNLLLQISQTVAVALGTLPLEDPPPRTKSEEAVLALTNEVDYHRKVRGHLELAAAEFAQAGEEFIGNVGLQAFLILAIEAYTTHEHRHPTQRDPDPPS